MMNVVRHGPTYRGTCLWVSLHIDTDKTSVFRWKKQAYLVFLERDLYHLFLGQDSSESIHVLHGGDMLLVFKTTRHLLPPPVDLIPQTLSSFFIIKMVHDAIVRITTCRAHHDAVVVEHLMYARSMLAHLLAHLFNRALWEGCPKSWSAYNIWPMVKSYQPFVSQ